MDPLVAARFRMIDVVVEAARLVAAHCGADYQLGDFGQVAQLDRVGVEQMVPVVAVDFVLHHQDSAERAFEPAIRCARFRRSSTSGGESRPSSG